VSIKRYYICDYLPNGDATPPITAERDDGWLCLYADHAAVLAAKDAEIAALRGQVGRLVRLVKALETPKRRGPFGGGTDPRDTEINNASVDCRQHNDLQPPAGKESSDGHS